MKEVGILGYPLGHTLSPVIHKAGYKELGLDIKFNIWEVAPENLEKKISDIRKENVLGSCVTLPHKKSVISFIDKLDESAKEMDAVNWIVNNNGKLFGYNTDWIGFTESLKFYEKKIKDKNCLILGAGGSAKAVCMALIKGEARSIDVYNRTVENTKKFLENFENQRLSVGMLNSNQINNPIFIKSYDLIINTTSVGMSGGSAPNISPINTDNINNRALCYDLVYSPEITPFIQSAKNNNIETIGGLAMLVFQAIKGFELVTKQKAPIKKMLEAVGIKK